MQSAISSPDRDIYRRAFDVSHFYLRLLTTFGAGTTARNGSIAVQRQRVLAFWVLISFSQKDKWKGRALIEWDSFSDSGPFRCPSNECHSSEEKQSSLRGPLCTAGNEKWYPRLYIPYTASSFITLMPWPGDRSRSSLYFKLICMTDDSVLS